MGTRPKFFSQSDWRHLRLAIGLAWRGYGATSPNPMVGAVLVKSGKIIGRGWHRRAGGPHAEIEALRDAQNRGHSPRRSTLYVTLEPCCTRGRTPPCTEAIKAAGIRRVVIGATDPNPKHSGRAFKILKRAGVTVTRWGEATDEPRPGSRGRSPHQILADECQRLNEVFNHWIVHRTPFVTVKAAMTMDGKIATATGESKWITGEVARACAMKLRQGADAVLVGINTILADDPSLTARTRMEDGRWKMAKPIRRIILDSMARTPLKAKVANDRFAALTTIVASKSAPKNRVAALARRVNVLVAPIQKVGRASPRAGLGVAKRSGDGSSVASPHQHVKLPWLLKKLGAQNVTNLLVEGGGEVNASFLLGGLAQRVAFFYAPKILGGRDSRKAVAGEGARSLAEVIRLRDVEWKRIGPDLLLTARVIP
ncbi:MAG: dihydrofolate reductase family protein [Verrucomicrobiota bacterium]|jgi:diaminohydroxyphosphoribosylaminopyrimidine deaminase/5-amino-6-(5-phosphoribosylamino)uracil reductase